MESNLVLVNVLIGWNPSHRMVISMNRFDLLLNPFEQILDKSLDKGSQ